ncbi:hypothetical protein [Frankia gtarii]|uniref:hypothetical protein n=1 Tax=Frankia gtarii TaxID=2950102 RepID=UPI0021BF2688|nr:hypothetical protein [Frankia gtarii]
MSLDGTRHDGRPAANSRSGQGRDADQWREILLSFVDDPRAAVEQADRLVDEAVRALQDRIEAQRGGLREAWRSRGEPSTEDLRMALRGYRDLCQDLLAYDRGESRGFASAGSASSVAREASQSSAESDRADSAAKAPADSRSSAPASARTPIPAEPSRARVAPAGAMWDGIR